VVAVLLAARAGINKAGRDRTTPLHTAAQTGHEAVVRALLAWAYTCPLLSSN